MTRARDISKIVTDANLSGTLDVTGTVTAGGLTVEGSTAPTINRKSTDAVVVADDVVGAITFEESDATGGTGVQAFIKAIANDSGSTYDMSIGVGGNTEAIRIDQSGSVTLAGNLNVSKVNANTVLDGLTGYSLLKIKGDSTLRLDFGTSADDDAGRIQYDAPPTNVMRFYTDGTEAMRIDSNGDVGIGTTNAFAKLVVEGDSNSNVAVVNAIGTSPNYIFDVRDDGTSKFRVDGSGNVGIGTSSPSELIHANGSAVSGLQLTTDTYTNGTVFKVQGDGASYIYNTENAMLRFGTNNLERIRILSGGEVAIGGSGYSGQPFSVQTSTNNVGYMQSTGTTRAVMNFVDANSTNNVGFGCIGNNHVFMKDATERMRIDSSGNVGIGTTSPQDIIDIRGGASSSFIFGTGANAVDSTLTLEFRDRYGTSGFGQGQIASFIRNARSGSTGNYDLIFGTNTGTTTNASERMRIDSGGDYLFLGGTLRIKDSGNTAQRGAIYGDASSFHINAGVNNLIAYSAGTERMRIDSSGNVGIGTTNPSATLDVNGDVIIQKTTGDVSLTIQANENSGAREPQLNLKGYNTGSNPIINFGDNVGYAGFIEYENSDNSMRIGTNTSEAMRINSSGVLLVGITDANDIATTPGASITGAGSGITRSSGFPALTLRKINSYAGEMIRFVYNGSTDVGSIDITSSSTSYNTSSDHRLKENVSYDFDATTRLKQLKPARFNFIADADTTVDGFLAHEVQSVVPEAISGTHNEVDDDGNPVYQGIDQSKLVPLLVKTIQELEARIVALETA